MGMLGKIRRSLVRYVIRRWEHTTAPTAKECPPSVLKFLGVADPSYRTNFYTLARIVEQMAPRGGLMVEWRVARNKTSGPASSRCMPIVAPR
jgi:hypothetical protein